MFNWFFVSFGRYCWAASSLVKHQKSSQAADWRDDRFACARWNEIDHLVVCVLPSPENERKNKGRNENSSIFRGCWEGEETNRSMLTNLKYSLFFNIILYIHDHSSQSIKSRSTEATCRSSKESNSSGFALLLPSLSQIVFRPLWWSMLVDCLFDYTTRQKRTWNRCFKIVIRTAAFSTISSFVYAFSVDYQWTNNNKETAVVAYLAEIYCTSRRVNLL